MKFVRICRVANEAAPSRPSKDGEVENLSKLWTILLRCALQRLSRVVIIMWPNFGSQPSRQTYDAQRRMAKEAGSDHINTFNHVSPFQSLTLPLQGT
jgi:hypothetical protein